MSRIGSGTGQQIDMILSLLHSARPPTCSYEKINRKSDREGKKNGKNWKFHFEGHFFMEPDVKKQSRQAGRRLPGLLVRNKLKQ